MNVPEPLRPIVAELGLEPGTTRMWVWAQNQAEYGSQQFAIGDRRGPRVLLTRARSERARTALAERHAALHVALAACELGSLRAGLAVPEPVAVGDEIWLRRAWIVGRNGTVDGRRSWSSACLLAQLRSALDFAATVAAGARTLVHYDLCPDNVLVGPGTITLLDFEYWDHGPAIDNVFDALLGWGAVIGLRPWQRQGNARALAVWSNPAPALVAALAAHPAAAILRACGSTAVVDAFDRFVAIKAERQPRVYGSEHAFARRWRAIREAWRGLGERRRSPWLALA